jgi:radical SAM protein with 4Fe4S-binding SPASM domain
MGDKYAIDSHKLVYHPRRVGQWLDCGAEWECAKSVYPIYVEVSPFGACNHRCVFCAVDFVGYKPRSLDEAVFTERLTEMAALGVKSVMFAGEGEPLLWRPLPAALDHCTRVGIDTSLTTNLVLMDEGNADALLRNCSWIKASVNGGTAATYSRVHRTKEADFDRVLGNFRMAVALRREKGYTCTLGAQMLLLPENAHEAVPFASLLKEIGVDYLVIKPYSQHQSSKTRAYEKIDYRPFLHLEEDLAALGGDGFSVVFRTRTIQKLLEEERGYERCCAVPFFWAYVMSDGCLYSCSAFLQDDRFNLGNIQERTFREVWEGEKRRENWRLVREELSIDDCRENCRMDEINRYLWRLTHPGSHDNFI